MIILFSKSEMISILFKFSLLFEVRKEIEHYHTDLHAPSSTHLCHVACQIGSHLDKMIKDKIPRS